jgi:hypothetical protein
MALTVGVDTYISRADAEAYIKAHYTSTDPAAIAWMQASEPDCEILLRRAARTIDRQPLQGFKASDTQVMEFPRALYTEPAPDAQDALHPLLRTQDGWYIQTAVPAAVGHAQAEIVMSLLQGPSERATLQREGVKSFTIGHLSETYTGTQSALDSYEARQLLAPYTGGGLRIC